MPLSSQKCLSSAIEGQGTLAICYVADALHLTPLQRQIETMTPAASTTITLIKVPTPIKTTRVMRATTKMNALNVDIHLKIQKAYKYIDPLNIILSKTHRHLLDSGLVALLKDVTFENSARPCLVRKTRKKHQIRQPVTCETENVCYLINCAKCYDHYIGETRLQFHERMNNHKSDIRTNKKSNEMVRHFFKCGIQNLKPTVLEKVRSRDPFIRKAREQYYIELLDTAINAQ